MARNTTGRPATRPIVRRARTDSFEIISNPVVHPLARVLGLLIRLRAEITTLVAVIALYRLLLAFLPAVAVAAIVAVLVALVVAVPLLRHAVTRRAGAVMTRHRLRQVLVERRCLNFSRHAPLFLWSHPTEVGETVFVLLRAGISPSDVEGEVEWIASGCFAREARVTPVRNVTALLRVEVIRRDPLTEALIASELDDWAATTGQPAPRGTRVVPPTSANQHWSGTGNRAGNGNGTHHAPAQRRTLDEHDDVPVVIEHPPADRRTAQEPQDAPREEADRDRASVPTRGGDWSDYV